MFDVAVLGAGPAGAVLARQLARTGHRVVLIGRHRVPRRDVGEALSPAIWPLLEGTGIRNVVEDAVTAWYKDTRIRWRSAHPETVAAHGAVFIDRARLDSSLVDAARRDGVRVMYDVARRPQRMRDTWRIPLPDSEIQVPRVVDASGRCRLLAGPRTNSAPKLLAVNAFWRSTSTRRSFRMYLDTFQDGWVWAGETLEGMRTIAFVDPITVARGRGDLPRLCRDLLSRAPLLCPLLEDHQLCDRVRVHDATPYLTATPVTANSIKIGEAAFAVDPLSSSGVLLAIQSAIAGAAAVNTQIRHPQDSGAAVSYYVDLISRLTHHHAEVADQFYTEHVTMGSDGDAGTPLFWARRAARRRHNPTAEPDTTGVRAPAGRSRVDADKPIDPRQRVKLSSESRFTRTPCLVGDLIELRWTISHPSMPQPVAFLDDVDVAPLVAALSTTARWSDLTRRAQSTIGDGRAEAVCRWLLTHGLLEPC